MIGTRRDFIHIGLSVVQVRSASFWARRLACSSTMRSPIARISDILDYLYVTSPILANLHMCKVEIGGDTQSTDGTEASYKHYREEPPACSEVRGYEMWLLAEAYKRNPTVQRCGDHRVLSWGVPNPVGNGTYFSEESINCQVGYAPLRPGDSREQSASLLTSASGMSAAGALWITSCRSAARSTRPVSGLPAS